MRILVVDDNRRSREVVAATLASLGLAPGEADTGAGAVEALADATTAGTPYGVVLLDLEMAELDGFETAAEIRALGLDPPPRLILMIGAWGEEVTDEARQVGIEYLLPKPFTPSLLLNIIGHAVHDPVGGPALEPELVLTALPARPDAWRGRRVLLVEDNELNQEVALGLLDEFGLAVDLVADGAAAVDRVLTREPGHYALVLMDIQMPVMDGLAATRSIRRSPGHAGLPIVAMTANAMAEDRDRCLAAGMNDHVAKPIEPGGLHDTLLRWLGGEPIETGQPRDIVTTSAEVPAIAGLDTTGGLRRMMGNAARYVALLLRFAERQAGAADEIAAALQAGDRATAERLAHTLRGLAATIGANAVAEQAQQVEAAIRGGAGGRDLAADIERLMAMLAALIGALRRALPREMADPRAALADIDHDRADTASRRLADLLVDSDVAAIAFLTENSALLRQTLGEHFHQIEAAIEEFDFAAALSVLQRAPNDLENRNPLLPSSGRG